jgi:transcriptional/translational regulatory protein YebC/TACO1
VEKVEQRLTEMNLLVLRAETEFRAISMVNLDEDSSACTQSLYELLQSDEDVVKVFDNIDPGDGAKSAAA